MPIKVLRGLLLPAVTLLAGCNTVLMSPSGDVALQQRNLIITSLLLMLLIIIPVIALTLVFAWRYRASNKDATYDPEWNHSTVLELLIWAAPLLIIIALGALTWVSTHKLDPYHRLERISEGRPVPAGTKPLVIDVVALDWKWLFIYPEQGIATVNEVAAPVDRPVEFRITASTVMNSFFIPALAGQIYAMPGMETKLQAVINKPGVFEGFSANYSGAGFSGMRFTFRGMSEDDFAQWVGQAKTAEKTVSEPLSRAAYLQLAPPSEHQNEHPGEPEPVRRYASVDPGLYDAILNNCVQAGKACMSGMAAPASSAAHPAADDGMAGMPGMSASHP